jgi:UDP-N-acetylglucosamine transferase subunit ALG13
MIFVTVGSQLPFDRLVKSVEAWSIERDYTDIFAQIADPGPSGFYPKRFGWAKFLGPNDFTRSVETASLLVAHAGMGSIISALTLAKPIVIMPRRGALGETRNDHQHATAINFASRAGIYVAMDEQSLPKTIDAAMSNAPQGSVAAETFANRELLESIRQFIFTGAPPRASSRGF